MGRFEVGDKIVLEISGIDGKYMVVDKCVKPLSEYTEPLEKKNHRKQHQIERLVKKLHRQADEITRLLKENAELKKSMEIIRDNSFEAGQVKGQNEAWELARNIFGSEEIGYKIHQLNEIFDKDWTFTKIVKMSYQEAAEKVADWERQKEVFKPEMYPPYARDILQGMMEKTCNGNEREAMAIAINALTEKIGDGVE